MYSLWQRTAPEAVDLINVEYELLPSIASIQEALDNPETRIHAYGEIGNVHRREAPVSSSWTQPKKK